MTIDLTNPAWPYLVFAEQLNRDLALHAPSRERFASYQGVATPMPGSDPVAFAKLLIRTSQSVMSQVDEIFTAARITAAFGNASHPSDEPAIRTFADDFINGVYAKLVAWSLECFGAEVPADFVPVFRALGNLMSRPLQQIDEFCADVTSRATTIDADLQAGRTPSVNFTLTFSPTVDDVDMRAYNEALAAIKPVKRGFFRRR